VYGFCCNVTIKVIAFFFNCEEIFHFCYVTKVLMGVSAPDSGTVYTAVLQNNELCAQQHQIDWNYKITAVP